MKIINIRKINKTKGLLGFAVLDKSHTKMDAYFIQIESSDIWWKPRVIRSRNGTAIGWLFVQIGWCRCTTFPPN